MSWHYEGTWIFEKHLSKVDIDLKVIFNSFTDIYEVFYENILYLLLFSVKKLGVPIFNVQLSVIVSVYLIK